MRQRLHSGASLHVRHLHQLLGRGVEGLQRYLHQHEDRQQPAASVQRPRVGSAARTRCASRERAWLIAQRGKPSLSASAIAWPASPVPARSTILARSVKRCSAPAKRDSLSNSCHSSVVSLIFGAHGRRTLTRFACERTSPIEVELSMRGTKLYRPCGGVALRSRDARTRAHRRPARAARPARR